MTWKKEQLHQLVAQKSNASQQPDTAILATNDLEVAACKLPTSSTPA